MNFFQSLISNLQSLFFLWLTSLLLLTACGLLPTADSTSIPPLITDPPPPIAYESLTAVTNTSAIPARDMAQLAARFRGIDAPRVAQTEPTDYRVGDVIAFWFKNLDTNENEQIEAALMYRSDELNMWVQAGQKVQADEITAAANFIETRILPADRAFFGQEWRPGVDGDDRINILHLQKIGGVGAAYYWSGDEYVTAVNPYSNQREMLYVSLENGPVGGEEYYQAIAHEMQHLIQWYTDANEDAWLNEGLGELAGYINGFDMNRAADYTTYTDIQLNTFSQERDVVAAHYAASTLFSIYFLDRFGEGATRALVRHPANGVNGITQMLAELETGLTFDDLFADWLAANYLTGEDRGQGVYQYASLEMPAIKPQPIRRFPAQGTATVSQYGADFIQLSSDQPLTVVFTGTQQVNLVQAEPYSGRYFWASSPADESDMQLTRPFDLTGLDAATLTFWTWYGIEAGWDYGYVAVSTDNGRTWDLLDTQSTTRDNPQGNSFGAGFTGVSGGGESPVWIQETADLTPYTGRQILVRFQYLTDGAVHEQGFIIDDIAIPELDYFDDAEDGDGGWKSAGFARAGHILPQSFIVQQILLSDDEVRVRRLQLDENQQGWWQFPMDNDFNQAILIISGNTPVTRQTAVYAYEVFATDDRRPLTVDG